MSRRESKGRKKRRKEWLLLAALLAVATTGPGHCDILERRKILQMVEAANAALLAGDASTWLTLFAPDYNDGWIPFDQAQAQTRERLRRRPLPVISFGKREVELNGDRAVVIERFTLEDEVKGRRRRYEEIQHLLFERRAEGWRCLSGSKLLALLGGRMEEEYEIERTLLRREGALVKEDVEAYMELVAPNYRYKNEGPDQLRERLLQIFRVYDDIEFRSFDRRIYFLGTVAEVQQKFNMTAVMMGTPQSFNGEERFELIRTEEGWKFTKGL